MRRAAISLGFISLLDGLAAILERECTLLPGGAHPDCALQLTHAANVLRKPFSRDPKFSIVPMRTRFHEGDNWYVYVNVPGQNVLKLKRIDKCFSYFW